MVAFPAWGPDDGTDVYAEGTKWGYVSEYEVWWTPLNIDDWWDTTSQQWFRMGRIKMGELPASPGICGFQGKQLRDTLFQESMRALVSERWQDRISDRCQNRIRALHDLRLSCSAEPLYVD